MARDINELLGIKSFGLRTDIIAIGILGLLAGAYGIGLIGPSEQEAVKQPTFDQAAAAAQAKADARKAQAEAARKSAE